MLSSKFAVGLLAAVGRRSREEERLERRQEGSGAKDTC